MRVTPREKFYADENNPYGMDQDGFRRVVIDKPVLFPDLDPVFKESGTNSGYYYIGMTSTIRTRYDVNTYPSSSYLLYKFTVTGATIVAGGSGHSWVEVETKSATTDTFTIDVQVTNATDTDSFAQDFTHTRTERDRPLRIISLNEDTSGSCIWDTTTKCVATSTYSVTYENDTGALTYEWSCIGAEITDNLDGTATVLTNSDEDKSFIVSLVLSDDNTTLSTYGTFSHTRTENHIETVILTDITEDSSGSCSHYPGENCTSQSTYTVHHEWGASFSWTTDIGTIVLGQGTDSITIETTSALDLDIEVQCIVSNAISFEKRIETFTHTRTVDLDPVNIVSLTESISGSCNYNTGGTCVATSTYDLVASDYDTLLWEVTGATIASGQGTTQITVITSSDTSDTFTVECTASGAYGGTDTTYGIFTHTRIEDAVTPPVMTDIAESGNLGCEYDGL